VIRWLLAVGLTAVAVVGGVVLLGPAPDTSDSKVPRRTPSVSAPASASAGSSPEIATATAPLPRVRACYRLSFAQALAPVSRTLPRSCDKPHTARTVFVGRVVDRAVDCPARVAAFLGGPVQALRLSMFRPVWFTPSRSAAEAGQEWYRCDVIALSAEGRLAPLEGRLDGLLATTGWKDVYGLCGTAEPGTAGFDRVSCARRHSWRAISTVPFAAARYPGETVVRDRGEAPCTDAARALAEDPLDFRWGYEWPTLEQWRAGTRYGVCWAPEA
jgi:Septum formation